MRFLRQSTATAVVVGPFLDKSDALTPKTALADQSAVGRLVKVGTGAAFVAASWAHDGLGGYAVGLTTAHTDTVGRLRLAFSDPATYCPVWEDFSVLSAAIYDWLFGSSAPVTTAAPTPPSVAEIVAGVWDEPQAGHVAAGTFGVFLDAAVSTRSTYAGGAVASVTAPVTVAGGPGGPAPTADEVAAAVWVATIDAGITARGMLAGVGCLVGLGQRSGVGDDTSVISNALGAFRVTEHTDVDGNTTAAPTLNLPT
jgi:hypothetical protein